MRHRTTSVAEALAGVITRQRRILASNWTRAAEGDVRALHRARVASRRLREALAMAATLDAGDEAARARRAARRVTRAFGPVREIDVALGELDRIAGRHGWPAGATAAIRRWLEHTRAARRRGMRRQIEAVGRGALRARSDRAAHAVAAQVPGADVPRALAAYLARRADRVIERADLCGTLYSVERLHALRIAVKKLRYTLETLRDQAGASAAPAILLLRGAQQRLGRLHDVQVLMGTIQSAAGDETEPSEAWSAILDDLERECRERHADIVKHLQPLERGVQTMKRDARLALGASGRRPLIKALPGARRGRLAAGSRRTARRSA
jgi:CHAD domain-containing protein